MQSEKGRTVPENHRVEVRRAFSKCPLPLFFTLALAESLRWKSHTPKVRVGRVYVLLFVLTCTTYAGGNQTLLHCARTNWRNIRSIGKARV
jgi:hypothetical protein